MAQIRARSQASEPEGAVPQPLGPGPQPPTPGPGPPAPNPQPLTPVWLGRRSYDAAHQLQMVVRDRLLAGAMPVALLLTEHDPVITLGRRGDLGDLLVDPSVLAARGIALRFTERGGRATYHGPGQLVGYPVGRLRALAPDVPTYVWRLEETIIRVGGLLGILATRSPGRPGVWVGDGKLASIGIALTRGVCWHGFALNIGPDLEGFRLIRPCGLEAEPTSVARWVRQVPAIEEVADLVAREFRQVFGLCQSPFPLRL